MYSCWRSEPLERPTFSALKIQLEKFLERLPDIQDKDSIIYINTQFPESSEDSPESEDFSQLDMDIDPDSIIASCTSGATVSMVTAEVHKNTSHEEEGRYILNEASEEQVKLFSASPDTTTEEEKVVFPEKRLRRSGAPWSQTNTLPVKSTSPDTLLFADDSSEESEEPM